MGRSLRRSSTCAASLVTLGVLQGAGAAMADLPRPAAAQTEGASHPGPRGYHAMCAHTPALCRHDRQAGRRGTAGPPMRMDAMRWAELRGLNAYLNARIRPAADMAGDHWAPATEAGDCEDYAIAKKLALIEAGWAADQLLIAIAEGRDRGHHAVLVVRTEDGEHVLDNLTDDILPWQETRYRFVIRQSAANPHAWVHVGEAHPGAADPIVTR